MSSLRTAIQLARTGKKLQALEILRTLVEINDLDIYAWLWVARCTPDFNEAIEAVEHVLSIRPTHQQAEELLKSLQQQRTNEKVHLPDTFPVISIWRNRCRV